MSPSCWYQTPRTCLVDEEATQEDDACADIVVILELHSVEGEHQFEEITDDPVLSQ